MLPRRSCGISGAAPLDAYRNYWLEAFSTSPVYAKAWPVAPDLAVEAASPNQHRPALAAKAQIYLAAGTRLVWVVWPRRQHVDVWHPGVKRPLTRGVGELLDGEDVVPGFSYPIANLFK